MYSEDSHYLLKYLLLQGRRNNGHSWGSYLCWQRIQKSMYFTPDNTDDRLMASGLFNQWLLFTMIFRIPVLSYVLLATSPQPQSEDYRRKIVSLVDRLIWKYPSFQTPAEAWKPQEIPEEVLVITSVSILAQYTSLNMLFYKSHFDQQVLTLGLCYKRHEVDDYGYVSFLPHQHCSVFSMAQDLIATLWSSCSKYR